MNDPDKDFTPITHDELRPPVDTTPAGGTVTPPRRFFLERVVDHGGVSGTGLVAAGVEFDDGSVALRWLTNTPATTVFSNIDDVRTVHGHGGDTQVVYLD